MGRHLATERPGAKLSKSCPQGREAHDGGKAVYHAALAGRVLLDVVYGAATG